MTRILAATLLIIASGAANASRLDRPILSCDKAPLLAAFQQQLPDHILATTANTQPKNLSPFPNLIAGPLFRRTTTSLICIVVAVDAAGKAEAAEVSYPIGTKLNPQERQQILETTWPPAQQNGQARPSLVSITLQRLH